MRRLRYFYGSTQLAGSSFEYHGQPMQILKGRLIAVAVLVPYFLVAALFPPWDLLFWVAFLIALPFLVVKSRLFGMRMTSWRNIRFDFAGTYAAAAKVYLGLMLLVGVTFGLAAPYWTYARQRFLIGQTRLGTTQFDFRARAGDYYVAIILGGLAIVGGVVAGDPDRHVGPRRRDDCRAARLRPALGRDDPNHGTRLPVRLRGDQRSHTQRAFDNTYIGSHKLSCNLRASQLFWLYLTNALAAIASLGLLIPWAQVRLMRYQLSCMQVYVHGSLDEFVGEQQLTGRGDRPRGRRLARRRHRSLSAPCRSLRAISTVGPRRHATSRSRCTQMAA